MAFLRPLLHWLNRHSGEVPLRAILVVPFGLQTLLAVGLVGYLSYRSGQRSLEKLASTQVTAVSQQVHQALTLHLAEAQRMNQINQQALTTGMLETQDLEALERYFWQQVQISGVSRIQFASVGGDFVAAGPGKSSPGIIPQPPAPPRQGERYRPGRQKQGPPPVTAASPTAQQTAWYQRAIATAAPVWSLSQSQAGPTLSASAPVYTGSGALLGVVDVDLSLDQLQLHLQKMMGEYTSQVFILDAEGRRVMAVPLESPLPEASAQPFTLGKSDPVLRYGAEQVRQATSQSPDAAPPLQRLTLDRQQIFLQQTPLRDAYGLDWWIVVALPEGDLMAEVYRNTSYTILWCAATLLGAVGLGVMTARWITQPILRLNVAAKRLSEGRFDTPIEPVGTHELRQLSQSFSSMARQLQASFRALSKSEKRLQQIFEALPVGIAVHRPDYSIAYVNRSGEALLGLVPPDNPLDDPVLRPDILYRAGSDRPYPVDELPLSQALQGFAVFQDDLELRLPDRIVLLEVRAIPIFDDQGQVLYAIHTFQDITERRRAETLIADYNCELQAEVAERTAALRKSEATNQALLQAIPDLLIRVNRHGDYLDVRLGGSMPLLNPTQLKAGMHINEVLPLDKAQERMTYVHLALESQQVQTYIYELEVEGKTRFEEARLVPCAEDEVLVMVRDVSDRKRAEAALRDSEELFRRSFDDAAVGMGLLTQEGRWLRVNRALSQITGYGMGELLQKSFYDITHPDDLRTDFTYVQRCLSGELQNYQREKRYLHQQGHVVWVLVNVSLVCGDTGQPLYFISQIQNISERRAVERMKTEFISIVSHELRTPLTAIRGSLGLLQSGLYRNNPEKTHHMIEIAAADSERLVRLVNDILDLERLESGRVQLVRERCQVNQLMHQAVDTLQAIAHAAQVELVVMPVQAEIWASPDAVMQTLTNLLSNAIKFSPAGGRVWLTAVVARPEVLGGSPKDLLPGPGRAEKPGRPSFPLTDDHPLSSHPHQPHLLFYVRDQGRGIPADKLETIFGRFQQVDASDARKKRGTGLGLAICKNIVQQHGGQIWAESQVGYGSCFCFTLPLAPPLVDPDCDRISLPLSTSPPP